MVFPHRYTKLLDVCSDYGQNHDIIYNSLKSNLMLFDTQCYGTYTEILLNNSPLKYVDCCKYLGHNINNKLDDESDMKSKIGLLYGCSNMLIRKFYLCSSSVKNNCSPLIAVIHISVFYG